MTNWLPLKEDHHSHFTCILVVRGQCWSRKQGDYGSNQRIFEAPKLTKVLWLLFLLSGSVT